MDWRNRLRRSIAATSFVAGSVALFLVPALASAELFNDLADSLGVGGDHGPQPVKSSGTSGGGSATPQASPRAGVPPTYQPPLHGTNPHGQGDAATVELAPPATNPYPSPPIAGPELAVVGRSRGEQMPDGSYHGHITILGLAGNEILGTDTTEGQQAGGPLDPLNQMVLDQLCTSSGGAVCLGLVVTNSQTNGSGSQNSFSLATVAVGGPTGITANAVTSSGNISETSTCQTATGNSHVADANVAGAITADAATASSSSTACNDGTPASTNNSSSVINLQGAGTPIPAMGCENGVPNTNFTPLLPLLGTVCNADDPGTGGQAGTPYGVREALTVFILDALGSPLAKVTAAGPESRAVAPLAAPSGPAGNPYTGNPLISPGGGGGNPNNTVKKANVPGAVATAAEAGSSEDLAFTGADLLLLALFGCGVLGSGLLLSVATRGSTTA